MSITDKRMKKIQCAHVMEYYLAIKVGNLAIRNNTEGAWGRPAKWHKSNRKRQVLYDSAGMKDLRQSELQKVGWRLPGKERGVEGAAVWWVQSLSFARGRSSGGLQYNNVTPVSTTEHWNMVKIVNSILYTLLYIKKSKRNQSPYSGDYSILGWFSSR